MLLTFLKNYKKPIGIVVSIILACSLLVKMHTGFVHNYEEQIRTELQTQFNAVTAEHQEAETKRINDLMAKHEKDLTEALTKRERYFEAKAQADRLDLISKYETKLKIAEIKNESNSINDVLNVDTQRLLNQARGIVSPPKDYGYRFSEDTGATKNRPETSNTLLSRPEGDPVGNNQRRRFN